MRPQDEGGTVYPAPPVRFAYEAPVRVRFADTDAMGVVYHGRYFELLDAARTEWLRSLGVDFAELEAQGARLAVAEVRLRYLAPARFDDLLRIALWPTRVTGVQCELGYDLRLAETAIAYGTVRLVCVDRAGKPRRAPDSLRRLLDREAARCLEA